MSKYDEKLKKACEILNNTELDELLEIAVEAMDDAALDIEMEANQEWHAKITLESALMHIAENLPKRPRLTIPKRIAAELDGLIEEAYSCDSIYVWSDYFDYYEYIKKEITEGDELYQFMYPKNQLLGTSHRNIVILYLAQLDLFDEVSE